MADTFKWDALKRTDYYADNQHLYTFCGVLSQRGLFVNVAKEMVKAGHPDRALEMLDKCVECVPECNYPLDISYLGYSNELMVLDMVNLYYILGQREKASDLASRFTDKMLQSLNFYMDFYSFAKEDFDRARQYLYMVQDIADDNKDTALSEKVTAGFKALQEKLGAE